MGICATTKKGGEGCISREKKVQKGGEHKVKI